MPSLVYASLLPGVSWVCLLYLFLCQCPHGLMPHCYKGMPVFHGQLQESVNALSGCYLISTNQMPELKGVC